MTSQTHTLYKLASFNDMLKGSFIMLKRIVAFIGIIVFLLSGSAPAAAGLARPAGEAVSQIIVVYESGATSVVPVPRGMTAAELARRYIGRPGVSYAEPDQTVTMAALTPNDSFFKILQVKSFTSMSITEAWDITSGCSSVVVAVLDTGVNAKHPDLAGRIISEGYNFVGNNTDYSDDNGHGTMCAGIIAAEIDNGTGLAGATKGCRILPVKVLDSKGNGQASTIAAGITYATDHGANIINLSLGCPSFSQDLQNAVNYAYGKGILVVAASGNKGTEIEFPAACDHAVAVGAVTSSNEAASYSSHGSRQALVAVGSGIFSTSLDSGYAVGNGTSFAAPFVSSLAALLLSINPKLTPAELTDLMEKTATDLGAPGWDEIYGFGCVNFNAALKAAPPTDSDAPSAGSQTPQPAAPVVQPVIQPVVQPVAEPALQPAAQPAAEPAAQPAAEPAAQPAAEPAAQPAAEPAAQPAAQPVAQPVAEPVAQPATEPAAQPAAQSVAEPVAEPVAQTDGTDSAQQAVA